MIFFTCQHCGAYSDKFPATCRINQTEKICKECAWIQALENMVMTREEMIQIHDMMGSFG